MTDSVVSIRLPPIEKSKRSICLTELSQNDVKSKQSLTNTITNKYEIKKYYHQTKSVSQWYRKLNEYVDKNLSNSFENFNQNNSKSHCYPSARIKNIRKFSDLKRAVLSKQGQKRYTDFVSVERFKSNRVEESNKLRDSIQNKQSTQSQLNFAQIHRDMDDCNLGPFQNDLDDELQRQDFEEYILLQTVPTFHLSHLYFKIMKLFRYIAVTNVEGTVITLLSLTKLVKRSGEVVQAIEESNGIVILLNLLESGIVSVQLASMKLLICLCSIIYLRRMAIAYGAVELLVQLLVDPDDDIKLNAADLLANLAIVKEARLVMPGTLGIQHLVCLLNMTAQQIRNPKKKSITKKSPSSDCRPSIKVELEHYTQVEENRSEQLLKSVAMALWRFSHSLTNQQIMQKYGILPTLAYLVQFSNETILIPVLGILHGCSTNPIFRVSIRHEGILKYLIHHIQHRSSQVKLQCTRTLFNCLDDSQTVDLIRTLGGLKSITDLIKTQTENAAELLQNGWIEVKQDSSSYRYKIYLDDNRNAVTVNVASTSREPSDISSKSRLHLVGTGSPSANTTSSGSPGDDSGRHGPKSQSTSRSLVNIVTKPTRDSEDQTVTLQLLHSLLATAWKSSVGLPNKECLVNLGLCDSLNRLLSIFPPYLTIYYHTKSPVSSLLQKINTIEKVTSCGLLCLSRLTEVDKVKRFLAKIPEMFIKVLKLLNHSSPDIVVPTIEILTGMVDNWQFFQDLNTKRGFILIFSLQLHENKQIQQAALKCICNYLQKIPERLK